MFYNLQYLRQLTFDNQTLTTLLLSSTSIICQNYYICTHFSIKIDIEKCWNGCCLCWCVAVTETRTGANGHVATASLLSDYYIQHWHCHCFQLQYLPFFFFFLNDNIQLSIIFFVFLKFVYTIIILSKSSKI